MSERFEGENKTNQERPGILDIVKIDGRWAQVMAGGGIVHFLDTGEMKEIDWNMYQLKEVFNQSAKTVMELFGQNFRDEEIERIFWGGEEKKYPHLRLVVNVFGEYERKK